MSLVRYLPYVAPSGHRHSRGQLTQGGASLTLGWIRLPLQGTSAVASMVDPWLHAIRDAPSFAAEN